MAGGFDAARKMKFLAVMAFIVLELPPIQARIQRCSSASMTGVRSDIQAA
jgi:hypothetical protein